MKNLIVITLMLVIGFACKKTTDVPGPNSSDLIVANAWKLNRYTDTSGKTISESALNATAQYLLKNISFEFKADGTVRAIDLSNGTIINKGTWSIASDYKTMDINVVAFQGKFTINTIDKNKLTLIAPTGTFLTGLGDNIYMEFLPKI